MRVLYCPRRPLRAGGATALGLAMAAFIGAFAAAPATAAASATAAQATAARAATAGAPRFAAIKDSLRHTTDKVTGAYTARRMSVEVALAPRDEAGLNKELSAVYTKGSGQYHKFIPKGQFDQRYAPTAATINAVTGYLAGHGLAVAKTSSPFLLRATGSSTQVSDTFRTTLTDYKSSRGIGYFANSTPAYVPASLSGAVDGVVGLANTVRLHPMGIKAGAASGRARPADSSCETSYPTTQQLFNRSTGDGTAPVIGYGGGPNCTGLTPSQTNSIYGAPAASTQTQGGGVTTALFELSGYRSTDAQTWAQQFYGAGYSPDVTEVDIDGGPLTWWTCPQNDTCYDNYNGDIEVDADIEQELSVAPHASIDVYDASIDTTGQTALDVYTAIANDDTADTVSSSWGTCEYDVSEGYAESENTLFEQMALQGQSVFAAAGDLGPFNCLDSYYGHNDWPVVDDPAAQPWVISAGGTSLETDNPGANANPGPPTAGTETVWNPDNLCSTAAPAPGNDNLGGYFWCDGYGAGAGGSSINWGAPSWQTGAGVTSQYTTHGPSHCALVSGSSTPCRQIPDVSANSDPFTPYSEYCTGNDPTSYCGVDLHGGGWTEIGGTSLAAPLWGALTADRDSFHGGARSGNIGSLIYGNPGKYFNDIATPAPSSEPGVTPATQNGTFPTTSGYDEATGLGSPKFTAIIEG